MFETYRGPVLGTAEMLFPVSSTQQPFRFVALPESDQSTLQAAFQSAFYRNTGVKPGTV
jgi:mannose-1-phosphate guanylyltransferase